MGLSLHHQYLVASFRVSYDVFCGVHERESRVELLNCDRRCDVACSRAMVTIHILWLLNEIRSKVMPRYTDQSLSTDIRGQPLVARFDCTGNLLKSAPFRPQSIFSASSSRQLEQCALRRRSSSSFLQLVRIRGIEFLHQHECVE